MSLTRVMRPDDIPKIAHLRAKHRSYQVFLAVFALACLAGAVWLLGWYLGLSFLWEHLGLMLGLTIFLSWKILLPPLALILMPKIAIADADEDDLGGRSPDEIVETVLEVQRAFKGRERPNAFVLPMLAHDANAFTINALLIGNFFAPLNAVYFTRTILALLRPNELRTVIAHELAHFYGAMNLVGRMHGLFAFCMIVFSAALLKASGIIDIGGFWGGVVTFIAVIALAMGGLKVFEKLTGSLGHVHEFLADYEAAKRFGHVEHINALLRLAQRDEIMAAALQGAVDVARSNPMVNVPGVLAEIAAALPNENITLAEAEPIIRGILDPIAEGEVFVFAAPPTKAQYLAREKQLLKIQRLFRKRREWQKISWEAFDTIVPDGMLDEDELVGYIEALLAAPEASVSLSPTEQKDVPQDVVPITHPSYRRRILFLAKEFFPDRLSPAAEATA